LVEGRALKDEASRRDFKQWTQPKLLQKITIAAAVLVVGIAAPLFAGRFTSIALSLQMPEEYRYVHYTDMSVFDHNRGIELTFGGHDAPALSGTKAVTVHRNFGAYTNVAMSAVGTILEMPSRGLFWASHEYIPTEFRANSTEEVGYLIVVEHEAQETSLEYENGARAYRHNIHVFICNNTSLLAETTFGGNVMSSTSSPSNSAVMGDPPGSDEISEWVAQELARVAQ
jgi:hypothetical protein